ncbi:mucin-2-like [Engraulis encrasicolus]|uniref:mucin-2-like n=1 Tax=Engraulis encrasicolus TaxID=184585 RepID=UPI002FD18852
MEKFAKDESQPDPLDSSRPCSPDSSPEAERLELLYDILRLPTPKFQALCYGVRDNMTAEDLAKMFASWTEDRVRNNIFETMAEIEEKKTILSSSYQQRVQQCNVESTKEVPEVQVAPVTKEVFATVLDSLHGSSTDVTKPKLQFISQLNSMVNKMKTFPKRLKSKPKDSEELTITPEVCKTLSDLMALPDPEIITESAQSNTSLHSNKDRLYAEENINKASEDVQNILLSSAAPSSSHEDTTVVLHHGGSTLSVASVKSIHDEARGIVGTIVTELEELYESVQPKEIEMLEKQKEEEISEKTTEPEVDTAQNTPEEILPSQEKEEAEPITKHASKVSIQRKLYRILGNTQIKVRIFHALFGSQDIVAESGVEPSTEEGCQQDVDVENSPQGNTDLEVSSQQPISNEIHSEEVALTTADTADVTTPTSTEISSSARPTSPSHKVGNPNVGKKLKQMFTRTSSPPPAGTPTVTQETVTPVPETDQDGCREEVSLEKPCQDIGNLDNSCQTDVDLQAPSQQSAADTNLPPPAADEAQTRSEDAVNTPAGAATDPQSRSRSRSKSPSSKVGSVGVKLKKMLTKPPSSAETPSETPEVAASVPQTEDSEAAIQSSEPPAQQSSDIEACKNEQGDKIEAEPSPGTHASPLPETVVNVSADHKKNSLGRKFKNMFGKQQSLDDGKVCVQDEHTVSSSNEECTAECAKPLDSVTERTEETAQPQEAGEQLASDSGALQHQTTTEPVADTTASQSSPTPAKPKTGKVVKIFAKKKRPTETPEVIPDEETVPECAPQSLDATATEFQPCPGDEQLASSDGKETSEITDVVATDKNKNGVGRKLKGLFGKKPQNVPPAVVPPEDDDHALPLPALVQRGDGPDTISLASEAVVQQSIDLAYETVYKEDRLASCDGTDYKSECTGLNVAEPEPHMDTADVSHVPQDSPQESPPAAPADTNRPRFGKKLTGLFSKPQKPAAQLDILDTLSSTVEPKGGAKGPDVALVESGTPVEQTIASSSQTCLQDDQTTAPSNGQGGDNRESDVPDKIEITNEESQAPPVSEPLPAVAVPAESGNKRSFGRSFRNFFSRQPRNVSEEPKVPEDSQESVLPQAAESSTPEAAVSSSVEQTASSSLDLSATCVPTEASASLPEDQTAKVSLSPETVSDATSTSKKSSRLQIGSKLKGVFTKQSKQPQVAQETPADTPSQEVVPTEAVALRTSAGNLTSSSSPPPVEITSMEFKDIAEATAAIKGVMDRVRRGQDDVVTGTGKINQLMENGVLQPFVRTLVDKVFEHMSARNVSITDNADLEPVYAFARRSVQGLLVYVLGIFVPLLEEAEMNFVHDTMTERVVSEVKVGISSAVVNTVVDIDVNETAEAVNESICQSPETVNE